MDNQAIVTVAVGTVVKDKILSQVKKDLDVGRYEVDVLVHVKGDLTKGADSKQAFPAKINWQVLFALAASKLNKETRQVVIEAYNEALESDEGVKALLEEVKTPVLRKISSLTAGTTQPVAGKVTTNLTFDIVGQPTVTFAPKAD